MTDKQIQKKELLNRMRYFYMKTDGSYEFPNSKEGDLLKMIYEYLISKKKLENL